MQKRKKYLVDREFQMKMVTRVVILILFAILLSGLMAYAITVYMENKSNFQLYGTALGKPSEMVSVSRLFIVKPVLDRALLIAGILSVIGAAVSMFYYSHQLAGPLYHLEKRLEGMISGDYEEDLRFRKTDEFHRLTDLINRLQSNLKK
jgi:methyl-accepting chemotaxis protein